MSSSTSSHVWARLISLQPEKQNINLLCQAEAAKEHIVPEKWMMRQDENGDTWITNLSESLLQIDEDNYLGKNETEQILGGERIAFEIVDLNENQKFDYCIALSQKTKKSQLKREREESKESQSSGSKFKSKEEEAEKKLKSCEAFFKSYACVICSQIAKKCVIVQPCLHNFCQACFLDQVKMSATCPALDCGKTFKYVSQNKVIDKGFFLFKEGLGDLKISSKESSIKLQKDLEGDLTVTLDKKGGVLGVFIGPSSMNKRVNIYGIKLLANGYLYQGNWSYGLMNGEGMMTMPNGWCFKGAWYQNGLFNAEISKDGVTFYRGEVQRWEFHGKGVYNYSNGDVYDGQFAEGKKNGNGTMKYACGDVYKGAWKHERKEGKGSMQYVNGDVYEGEWKGDMRNGAGVLAFSDETKFEGQWKDDVREGEGVLIKNDDKYEGIWIKNEMQKGKVKISYSNKDEYYGEIDVEKLQRNGKGTLLKANGDEYVGQWKDDKQHGLGKETCKEDQSSFEGNWEKGKQVSGVLTESNGEKFIFEKRKVDTTKERRKTLQS